MVRVARRCQLLAAPMNSALQRSPRAAWSVRTAAPRAAASHAPFGVLSRPNLTLFAFCGNRFHGQRAGSDLVAAHQRQRQPEARAVARLTPGLEPTLVQPRIL